MNYALVGAFVLGLAGLLIAGLLWLAAGGALHKRHDLYLAIEEESVSGLNLNAPVKYYGVEVGKVREIELDRSNPKRVRLLLAIERGTPIKVDTVAVLRTQGLTGIAYVELDGGAPDSPALGASATEPYPVIRTKESLSTRLENVLTSVLAKVDRTSANIDALLSDANRAAVSNALADVAALTKVLAARKDSIDAGIVSAGRALAGVDRLATQLAPAAQAMAPLMARVGDSADAVQALGRSASETSRQVGQVALAAGADVRAASVDLQRFSADTLPEVQRLTGELNLLAGSLRRLSEQTERQPSSLLLGRSPRPPGPGELAVSP